jgi:ankyrin repeat protein
LINKGANPNAVDKYGDSPLLVAAQERNSIPIIDLLLEAQNVKGIGDINDQNKKGRTALHYAAAYSNEITAEHLINKGANVNHRAHVDDTPLHYAALGALNMDIIDLLLENINEGDIEQYRDDERLFLFARHNKYGKGDAILDRLVEKGITPPCGTETDDCTGESDEAITGVNTRRFVLDKGVDPSIDLTGFDDGLDFLIVRVKKSLEIDDHINGRDPNGETPLFLAIRANYVNAVRRLLERGADPTIRNNDDDTPFHVAVENCTDCEILNLLLESGKVDINETTKYGGTALHMAIENCNTAAAEFLLSKGANPNVTTKYLLSTPLHWAAHHAKDMDIVELLVNHKDVDVNLMDDYGQNALEYAMENENGLGERIANLLKEKGAVKRKDKLPKGNYESFRKLLKYTSSNAEDEIERVLSDATVPIEDQIARINEENLISAIRDSDVETLGFLLKNGADISNARGRDGENALHVASRYAETTDLIDFILETGKFDINGVDNNGWTPLHCAINETYNRDINARHLIQKGADPTIANKEGDTPLHLAVLYCRIWYTEYIETISLILENDQVDINRRGNNGRTPLHHAIKGSNVITVRYLLKKGADLNVADENGATPLHLAAETVSYTETTELIDFILETGKFDINGVDDNGRTPLHYAIEEYPATINARHLIQLGADPGIADKNGVTPLHLAAKNAKSMDLIDELLLKVKTGAVDVNCVDIKGRTPLACARDNKHGLGESIIARLKEYGAKE